jgi:hypothetical protein
MNDMPPLIEPCVETPGNTKPNAGRWKPGQSGNPSGYKKGSRHKVTLLLEGMLGKRGPELLDKIIEQGLAGDATCLKICADRLIPPRKNVPIKFKMPELRTISDAQAALAAIIAATAKGLVLVDEATALSGLVTAFAKMVEIGEIEARLTALEAANAAEQPAAMQYNA